MRTRSTGISTDPSRVTRGELAKTALNRRFRPISNPENRHRVCLLWPRILFRGLCCFSAAPRETPLSIGCQGSRGDVMPFQRL